MVNIYEWQFANGEVFGCGTELELRYWQQEGIVDPDAVMGRVVSQESASQDDRRKAMWGLADWHDKVPA